MDLEKFKEMYEQGETLEKIAEEMGISKSTVIRKTKKLPACSQEARDLNKRSKQFLNSSNYITNDLIYQDEEEGWLIDLKKIKEVDRTSSTHWMGIIYFKTGEEIEEFIRECRNRGLKVAISPLHNKDWWLHDSPEVIDEETGEVIFEEGELYKVGDIKKWHWHYNIQFTGKQSFKFMYNLHKTLAKNNVAPKPIYSPLGAFEYLWHKNEDLSVKKLYSRDEVVIINGYNPTLTTSEKDLILREIVLVIRENHFTNQKQVEEYFHYSNEIITTMGSRNYYISKILDEEWRMQNPDYIKRVMIVNEKEKECK